MRRGFSCTRQWRAARPHRTSPFVITSALFSPTFPSKLPLTTPLFSSRTFSTAFSEKEVHCSVSSAFSPISTYVHAHSGLAGHFGPHRLMGGTFGLSKRVHNTCTAAVSPVSPSNINRTYRTVTWWNEEKGYGVISRVEDEKVQRRNRG